MTFSMFIEASDCSPAVPRLTPSDQFPYYLPDYTSKIAPAPLFHAMPQSNFLGSTQHSGSLVFVCNTSPVSLPINCKL